MANLFGIALFCVYNLVVVVWHQYQCSLLLGKIHLQSDLLRVEWDVKLYSLTYVQLLSHAAFV